MFHNSLAFVVLLAFSAIIIVTGHEEDELQCFVPGKCDNSFSIHILSSLDELECLSLCKDEELCEWFTFYPSVETCVLFKNCTTIDPEACDQCISGQRECELKEAECWIGGECQGTIIDEKQVEEEIECLRLCKSEIGCKWFTFFVPGQMCFLFSECETFDETSEGCISGERRCKEESPTTTTTTTTTTPETTTEHSTAYSKVLVAVGCCGMVDVEIIDLSSSETTCMKPENFPDEDWFAVGGLGFQDKPVICAGVVNLPTCHLYEDGAWKKSDSINQGRYSSTMTVSPFQDGSSRLFLTGGVGSSGTALNSSEVLTENGWQVSVPLPVTIRMHCMVTFNSTSVMVIGGFQDDQVSGKSFLFNSETHRWTEGPTLNTGRYLHSCGSIRQSTQTQEKSLIAIGGTAESQYSRSVEVLDHDSDVWRSGTSLPIGIAYAVLVEDPSGGVVLIGGNSDERSLDTIYRLPHAGSDATWELMTQRLKTARFYHTAFLVPDEFAGCN